MEWLQSIEGLMTLSFGGITLGTVVTLIVSLVKSGGTKQAVTELKTQVLESKEALIETTEANKNLLGTVEDKEVEIERLEIEKLQNTETQNLTLKILSYIVSASGGIDNVTKVDVLNEIKNAQNKIQTSQVEFKERLRMKKEDLLKTASEKKEELLEKANEGILNTLDTIGNKASEIIQKHSKK